MNLYYKTGRAMEFFTCICRHAGLFHRLIITSAESTSPDEKYNDASARAERYYEAFSVSDIELSRRPGRKQHAQSYPSSDLGTGSSRRPRWRSDSWREPNVLSDACGEFSLS
ncbi:hypothetical protein EVAR_95647_1 [Eumeta japonica]|uniref:Uncharacterized protein n=1 Tax=Eumeta variegata TaxID=151549 RepID=A0A4C2AEV0_EUMVA|nr:hypothetical protein EVAR_95647_1 [Eumeta japonica]